MIVSALVVNWNGGELLMECLRSLQLDVSADLTLEAVLVDNASTDGSAERAQQACPWVRLRRNAHNCGFAAGNNVGVADCGGEFLLLLNPDARLHDGALRHMVAHLRANPAVGMVGPRLLNPDGSLQISAHPRPTLGREAWRLFHLDRLLPLSCYGRRFWQQREAQQVEVLMGACLLLRRSIVQEIGLFDERFFMYSEEVDLCTLLRAAGWRIDYLPTAEVTHYGGQSTRLVAEAMFLELYRSKVLYFRKHDGERVAAQYKRLLWLAALTRRLAGGERGRRYRLLMERLGGF